MQASGPATEPSVSLGDGGGPGLACGRNAVREILRDPSFRTDKTLESMLSKMAAAGHPFPALQRLLPAITFFVDPPRHAPQRRLLARLMGYRSQAELRPFLEEIVERTVGEARALGMFDVVHDLARPLACRSIAFVLGIDEPVAEEIARRSEQLIEVLEFILPLRRYRQLDGVCAEMFDRMGETIADRRREPRADSISAVLAQLDEGVTDDHLSALCVFLFIAGAETTLSSVSAAIRMLFSDPEACAALRSGEAELPAMVDLLLRRHSAVNKLGRIATEDRVIDGVPIPEGAVLTLMLGEANLDAGCYPSAESPLLAQLGGPPHLVFGEGAHFCLGAPLARALIACTLRRLLAEPAVKLFREREKWTERRTIRCLARLPATIEEH